MKILSMKPQNIFKVIKTAFLIWKRSLIKTIPFSLIFMIAYLVLVDVFFQKLANYNYEQFSLNLIFNKNHLLSGSKVILFVIIFSITNASTMYIINKVANDENVHFSQALTIGSKKAFSQLLIFILYFMILLIAPMLLIVLLYIIPNAFLYFKFVIYLYIILAFIPSIIMMVYFMFAMYQLIIEENSIIDAFKNSFTLVLGNWWYTFGTFLIISTIPSICSFIFDNFYIKNSIYINFFLKNSFSIIFITPLSYAFIIAVLYNLKAKNMVLSQL